MDFFRQWLLGVTACAMLVSTVCQICPEGGVRKITRFTGGLLILLAMLRPLTEAGLPGIKWNTGGYREAVAQLELELGAVEKNALADGIAAELEAYIEDKAESLGASVRARVKLRADGEAPLPERVVLIGSRNEALADWIASELGVAKEEQEWIENG